jgi:ATP-dependent Clp protease ATP-binding subunit ClpA
MTELGVYGERLAKSGLRVFESAVEESRRNQQNFVSFGHVLKALAAEDAGAFATALRGSRVESLLSDEVIEKMVAGGPDWHGRGVRISSQVISLFRRAMQITRAEGREKIEVADIFSALAQNIKGGKSLILLRVSTPHSFVVQG